MTQKEKKNIFQCVEIMKMLVFFSCNYRRVVFWCDNTWHTHDKCSHDDTFIFCWKNHHILEEYWKWKKKHKKRHHLIISLINITLYIWNLQFFKFITAGSWTSCLGCTLWYGYHPLSFNTPPYAVQTWCLFCCFIVE